MDGESSHDRFIVNHLVVFVQSHLQTSTTRLYSAIAFQLVLGKETYGYNGAVNSLSGR